jgi:hypothetical protein
VGWLLLAALGVMWAAFLLPTWRRHPGNTVKGFERDMDLLAETEGGGEGRWIVTPRKGTTFIGPRARAQARARERRRRVLVVLIESIALTALMGLFPPLRAMWYATAVLLIALGAYVWLLLSIKSRGTVAPAPPQVAPPTRARPARHRYAADASGRTARAAYNGLLALGDDPAAIVVRSAGTAGVAGV